MHRLLTVVLLCCTAASPALAQKKSYEKFVPKSQREAPEQNKPTDGEMRIPSREALNKSDLPGFAKCALNCARPQQTCNAGCRGNSACTAGCQKNYLACANRCGGPIGTAPRGGGGGGDDDRGSGCSSACVQALGDCKSSCGGKSACVSRCYEEVSSCTASCE